LCLPGFIIPDAHRHTLHAGGFAMTPSTTTYYLSPIIGKPVYAESGEELGKLDDLVIDVEAGRPRIVGVRLRTDEGPQIFECEKLVVEKHKDDYHLQIVNARSNQALVEHYWLAVKDMWDKQIVDIDGKKVVRVNDLRLAQLSTGTYIVAVDVGFGGLLRRLGVANLTRFFLGRQPHSEMILWDDVQTVDLAHTGIHLATQTSKLHTLHPSDLADILEDLDRKTATAVFATLNEEHAADVLEELEPDAQVDMMESMTVAKAADVLDELDEEKAHEILQEMEPESSEEVRDLLEYPDNTVGSIMITDFISFNAKMTVEDVLSELRALKPGEDIINYLYVLDKNGKLAAVVSLRDLVVAEPETKLSEIMDSEINYVKDTDRIETLAELLTKYSLLALPVVDEEMNLVGIGMIDDVVAKLLRSKRRR
jgi:magnesium transporter